MIRNSNREYIYKREGQRVKYVAWIVRKRYTLHTHAHTQPAMTIGQQSKGKLQIKSTHWTAKVVININMAKSMSKSEQMYMCVCVCVDEEKAQSKKGKPHLKLQSTKKGHKENKQAVKKMKRNKEKRRRGGLRV